MSKKPNNLLTETNHLLVVNRPNTDDLQLMVQAFELPTLTINEVPGPAIKTENFQVPGTKMAFDPLSLTILLDEDLDSWYQVYKWMKEIVDPSAGNPIEILDSVSQAQLHILTNNKSNNNIVVEFKNIWPSILGGFSFSTNTDDDVPPIVFDVTFNYNSFKIRTGETGSETLL